MQAVVPFSAPTSSQCKLVAAIALTLAMGITPAEAQLGSAPTASGFDFSEQPGEHPLAAPIRVLKSVQQNVETNVRDYSCMLYKQERLDDDLSDPQFIYMKVRNQPFSVYMRFEQPFQGREVLYVHGQNEGKLVALEAGWKRKLGPFDLDPVGRMAMAGQRYPITRVGIANLLNSVITAWEANTKYGESEVTVQPDSKLDGRSTTMIQVVHPVPRREFESHIARIFLDNELRVPIHYDTYLWPEQAGDKPPLDTSYTYRNLKLNVGLTANDFDRENPSIFRP